MIYELITKVMINVLLIFIFLSVFFFTYATSIEKNVIINQMKVLSNNFMSFIELSGNNINTNIYNENIKLLSPDNIKSISANDGKVLSENKNIIKNVIIYVSIFFIIVVLIVIYLVKTERVTDIHEILIESFIILIFIACLEYTFLTFFGSKFISIDTNLIKLNIVEFLQKYTNGEHLSKRYLH